MKDSDATKEATAATVREAGANAATAKEPPQKTATPGKRASKTRPGKSGKPNKIGNLPAKHSRTNSGQGETKGGKILELIRRPKGATLEELMKATAWQAHSVRGFVSNAGRQNLLRIASSKNEAGERVYRTAK